MTLPPQWSDADWLITSLTHCICSTLQPMSDIILPELEELRAKGDMDAYWARYAQHVGVTLYHPTSTCKMAKADDPTGVVTPDCRCKGVNRLRVVDASIMCEVPSGNTNIPTICLAERAADIIISSAKAVRLQAGMT